MLDSHRKICNIEEYKKERVLSMHSNLFLRTLSSLVLAPIVLGCIWFGKSAEGFPLYKLLLAALGSGLSWEWSMMFDKKLSASTVITTFFSCLVAFLTEENPQFALWLSLLGMTVVYWQTNGRLAYSLGTLYICIPILSLGYIYYVNDGISRDIVLWLLFVVWATDIGGYVVGKTVQGPKLAPKISAKKTWSGFAGAILFAFGAAYVFTLYVRVHTSYILPDEWSERLMVSAGILAVISQIGDFFESFIKRRLGVKDSSNLIPGHGGLFDRVDGLLFAAVAAAFVLFLFDKTGTFY